MAHSWANKIRPLPLGRTSMQSMAVGQTGFWDARRDQNFLSPCSELASRVRRSQFSSHPIPTPRPPPPPTNVRFPCPRVLDPRFSNQQTNTKTYLPLPCQHSTAEERTGPKRVFSPFTRSRRWKGRGPRARVRAVLLVPRLAARRESYPREGIVNLMRFGLSVRTAARAACAVTGCPSAQAGSWC